mgnify:CR=1 FL=1
MTRTGYEIYIKYLALQKHFSTDYDYFKFNGRVKASVDAYQKRNDMFAFEKLSKVISNDDLEDFFVAHFLENPKEWIKNMSKPTMETFKSKLRRMPSLFKEDLMYIKEQGPKKMMAIYLDKIPEIHNAVIKKDINIESIILLDKIYPFIEKHEQAIQLPFVWPEHIKKVKKYRPFVLSKLEYKYYEDIARDVLISS